MPINSCISNYHP